MTSGLITILAVGHQLLETSRYSSSNIIKSLKNTVIDSDHDWKQWRFNSTLNTSTSYVHVHNMRRNAAIENYYSPDTKTLLKIRPQVVLPIKGLYYRPHIGFLIYNEGHARGINYELWIKLNSQLEILERVVIITIIILILTLIITPLYIKLIAQRLTGSLTQLTKTAEIISTKDLQTDDKLPIPNTPTEVKQLAMSFNRLLSNLYQQNQKEKVFVSNAAHELRTPIATIQSHAQLLQRRSKEHPEIIDNSLKYITEESHQMAILIDELLALSRADKAVLTLHEYNLSDSLIAVAKNICSIIPQKLIIKIDKNIHINAHQKSVDQIITNIISNASKYSDSNRLIEMTLKKIQKQVIISVADQGIGISDKDKEHIFERFYRASTVRGSIEGTGLGLAIANQLAILNNAQLTVKANKPRGTIFLLHFFV
ncbi:Signal transduction histidine kinase [Liquorilactobacillus uvarum DSM 19971]|uniref:histidine kinase n=2 Tax=Liquorilactobacillus uvarum TaxID=303240 RepID=A0A0R1Q2Q6_9LACO|nr:Signal transduction histidine kinase [Liquorilactobacillus uvarum DSM 19971]